MRHSRTSSVTVMTISTFSWIIGKFSTPTGVLNPSAIVSGSTSSLLLPSSNPLAQSSAPAGSAPNTLTPVPSAASAVPARSPPPPTGATTAASGGDEGTCARSSSMAVPWPRIVFAASYGGTNAAPVCARTVASAAAHAGAVGAQNVIAPPYARTASILGCAELLGCIPCTTNVHVERSHGQGKGRAGTGMVRPSMCECGYGCGRGREVEG